MSIYFRHLTIVITLFVLCSCSIFRINKFKKNLTKTVVHSEKFPVLTKFRFRHWIYIKANVHSQDSAREFILDTGSPCVFSFKTKKDLGLQSKKLLSYAGSKTEYCTDNIRIGDLKLDNVQFMISDHEVFDNSSGLIGVNALGKLICELNFVDSTIKLSTDPEHFKHISGSYIMKFRPLGEQQTPIVKFAFGGDSIEAFLDTGYPGFIQLNSEYKPSKQVSSKISYRNVKYLGANTRKDYFVFTTYHKAPSLNVAGFKMDSVILTQSKSYKGRNLLGNKFLKNFIVTINWQNSTIYLKPIKNQVFAKQIYSYGFNCYPVDGVLKVTEVFVNSDAERLGLKSGDEITSIDSVPVLQFDTKIINLMDNDFPSDKEIRLLVKGKSTMLLRKTGIFH